MKIESVAGQPIIIFDDGSKYEGDKAFEIARTIQNYKRTAELERASGIKTDEARRERDFYKIHNQLLLDEKQKLLERGYPNILAEIPRAVWFYQI